MKRSKLVVVLALVAGIGAALAWWWEEQRIHPSTDDAYLQANILSVAAEVEGHVLDVLVEENQFVAAGDVLFRIEPSALEAARDKAKAELDIALQSAGASGADVASAEANVAEADATLADAEADLGRTQRLFELADVAQAALDQSRATRDAAAAKHDAAIGALDAARQNLGAQGADNAGVRAAVAALRAAQIDLDHATVTAPVAGWIANISLRPGQVVTEGKPLFSLVEADQWWVEANFKETDLGRIRPGQPATISVDMYAGATHAGTVESIGAGSGAVFSLLPPENATGNWVKVTQRFPVRIALDGNGIGTDGTMPFRVGASVSVVVDTATPASAPPANAPAAPAESAPSPSATAPAATVARQ